MLSGGEISTGLTAEHFKDTFPKTWLAFSSFVQSTRTMNKISTLGIALYNLRLVTAYAVKKIETVSPLHFHLQE